MVAESLHAAINAQPYFQLIGWAIVHSLWQNALIAFGYAFLVHAIDESSAGFRHLIGCVALLLMLAMPLTTASLMYFSGSVPRPAALSNVIEFQNAVTRPGASSRTAAASSPSSGALVPDEGEDGSSATESLRSLMTIHLPAVVPWLVVVWFVGVLLLLIRMTHGVLGVRALLRSARPVTSELQQALNGSAARLRVRQAIRLCESALVEVPTVIGHLKPVILLPACALTGLSPAYLEALLAHELAHIRRHDFLLNLLQTALETVLFYHPATWWLSRHVRTERENACDDVAVANIGDVVLYAGALASMEQLRFAQGRPQGLALAANGGSLMSRIQRLFVSPSTRNGSPLFAVTTLLFTLAMVAVATLTFALPNAGAAATRVELNGKDKNRQVAVTFVTFPGNHIYSDTRLVNKTRKLMRGLKEYDIRAVAFVNESRLYNDDGTLNELRVGLLAEWLDAGHDLGNETFRHTNLYRASLAEFQADVEGGEKIMSKLLSDRGRRLRYFSYPYLNTGSDKPTKTAADKYLRDRGYTIHQVTIDNMDWLFNRAYLEALRSEDEATAATIRAEYIGYMERMFEFTENYARDVVGREFPQILMLTAGALNADCLEALVAMMKSRGYSFVSMEEAMRDEVYSLPDNYTGQKGDSWISRWAVTRGMEHRETEHVNLPPYMQKYFVEFKKQLAGNVEKK